MITRKAAVIAAITIGALAASAGGYAAAATAAPAAAPAPGNTLSTTYACTDGPAFEYFEFNSPLPHRCKYSGQGLVSLPTIVLAEGETFPIDSDGTWQQCSVEEATPPGATAEQLSIVCSDIASSS